VAPLWPPSSTFCPASPALPWLPGASVPHLPGLQVWPAAPRYAAPLRLPRLRLGVLRLSLVRRYPGVVLFCTPSQLTGPRHPAGLGGFLPRRSDPALPTERRGSPQFPSDPSDAMPRAQPPVVSRALARAHPGLLPSGAWKPSAFPSLPRRAILGSTTIPSSGLQHAACHLAPPSSAPPGLVAHVGFAPDRLARRWSGGPCARSLSPPGSPPRVSEDFSSPLASGFSWRYQALVRKKIVPFQTSELGNSSICLLSRVLGRVPQD
jgi:hypothetical protein